MAAVYQTIASAMSLASGYKCQTAIKKFESLPPEHVSSPYIQAEIARIHSDNNEYEKVRSDLSLG